MFARVEVALRPEYSNPSAERILRRVELALPEVRRLIRWARLIDVYWLNLDVPREMLIPAISDIFLDRTLNWLFTGDLIPSAAGKSGGIQDLMEASPHRPGIFWGLEKRFRPGVTDNIGRTTIEAFEIVLGKKIPDAKVSSGTLLLLEGPRLTEADLSKLAREVFSNDLIESWTLFSTTELDGIGRFQPDQVKRQFYQAPFSNHVQIDPIKLIGLQDAELERLSNAKLWALSAAEMVSIQRYFLSRDPTDAEMEVLAQTWSEHCKHKIFGAKIFYEDRSSTNENDKKLIPREINGLFEQTIRGVTQELTRPWLLSVFEDNAGIIAFDDEDAVCIKVETHNSPSALDPYGGALTGIVGVNRDILGCGRGAKPIFNTDVFCVATPDFSQILPEGILHPRRILDGIRHGVEDGGNKSGIPTINGALVFDHRYLGKPLVYCGTGGIMPRVSAGLPCEIKSVEVGDAICMVGGRIGRDGIHGATFSSMALDAQSPASAVQLGDPITQKRLSDFILEARELGLYRSLTDNGAGGLSSSVGEMAKISGGAKIDVSKAKTKMPGLRPYELIVSESQERMTMAVPKEHVELFLALADRRGVEVSLLGEFTNSGIFEVFYGNSRVVSLDLEFLHEGLPRMQLEAVWNGSPTAPATIDLSFTKEGDKRLLELLSRPNIASKEWLIRQYDHEVQGTSVIKPLHTASVGNSDVMSGPNDAAVIKPKAQSWSGVAVGCGINPKYSDIDPYLMAQVVVDEAVRNALAVGAGYGSRESVFALIDNFCWPDPVGDPVKTGSLVRACYGMREAALALELPFISGKDSMKNDYRGKLGGREIQISVPPTLLITAIAKVTDIRHARSADFKAVGDFIYLLGGTDGCLGLYGSELHAMVVESLRERGGDIRQVVLPASDPGGLPNVRTGRPDWPMAKRLYGWIGGTNGESQFLLKSLHDVSEGGILGAISESLLARGFGASIVFPAEIDQWEFAFGEGFHSFIATVSERDSFAFEEELTTFGVPFMRLGKVTALPALEVTANAGSNTQHISVPIQQIRHAWLKQGYWQ